MGVMAARIERASRRDVHQVGRQAANRGECVALLIKSRDRVEQALGVGMGRLGVQLKGVSLLHDAAGVHHGDPIRHVGHHAEVVSDQDEAHLALLLQVFQKLHDLGLHGHVQGSCRLVGDQHSGIQCDRHGDHDALPHTAGELMRIGLDTLGSPRDLHPLHEPYGLGSRVRFVHSAVLAEHLGDLPTHGKDGVECGQRVLEDHRDLRAADPPPLSSSLIARMFCPQ